MRKLAADRRFKESHPGLAWPLLYSKMRSVAYLSRTHRPGRNRIDGMCGAWREIAAQL